MSTLRKLMMENTGLQQADGSTKKSLKTSNKKWVLELLYTFGGVTWVTLDDNV